MSSRAVKGVILEELQNALANSWASLIANSYTSDQASETYAGAGNVTPMREWIGPKQAVPLNQGSFVVTNKDWEATLELFKKDLDRDKTDQLRMKAAELGVRAVQHEQKLLSSLINVADGTTLGTAFDGLAFFSASHVFGSSGTLSNSISYDVTTTTAPTPTESANAILTAVQQMYGFKDSQGEPTNGGARKFAIMCPVSFWNPMRQATSVQYLTNGVTNPVPAFADLNFTVIPNPYLTWTDKFAVFCTDSVVKPMLTQTEVGPTISELAEGSDHYFKNGSFLYSVEKRSNAYYQRYDKACLVSLI